MAKRAVSLLDGTDIGAASSPVPSPSLLDMVDPAPATPPPAPVSHRSFSDVAAARRAIYEQAFNAVSGMQPVSNSRYTLTLTDPEWVDGDERTKADRKRAMLTRQSLGRRIRGTWKLTDNQTGEVVDQRRQIVARIPHMTEGGTFVFRGNEYIVRNQARLRPGVYVRRKQNDELEAYTNLLEGGPAHRYHLDPDKGTFHIQLGGSKTPLMPVLRALGATDAELREAWGPELFAANKPLDTPAALAKVVTRLARADDDVNDAGTLKRIFERMKMDPEVNRRTLGKPYSHLNKDALLSVTQKLLRISRNEQDPDDRDHLAYQQFVGPEEMIAERLAKDRAGVRRQLLFKATNRGSLRSMPSAALQDQIDSLITEAGLAVAVSEGNPLELLDKQTQATRLGEGGIGSTDMVPDEARNVHPSHFTFIDPIRAPETMRAGIDTHLSRNALKGSDGKLYAPFINARTGKSEIVSAQQVADSVVSFPGATKSEDPRVPAMKRGQLQFVPKDEIDYELESFETAFSPASNLIPLKSMTKGQRVAMGARMLVQSVPLVKSEAPLVQTAVPGTKGRRSYEREYAGFLGAQRADKPGKVLSVDKNNIRVRYDDGTEQDVELYDHLPHDGATYITQYPVVKPGQRFERDQLLARSNYTDDRGEIALGLNARVGYIPWGGLNYEDAAVISESMARRLTSDHLYKHSLDKGDRVRTGKRAYLSLFPGRFDRRTLDKLDDDGIIKPGTTVHAGEPLILGAVQKETAANKVHRKKSPAYSDVTQIWENEDPGYVTDVVNEADGIRVLVRSERPMRVADKLSGRFGDKSVIAAILPDDQMPRDERGRPLEILVNPKGTISRVNPSQIVEGALGKLAELRGEPIRVEDFGDEVNMARWALRQLKDAGLSDKETLTDPATGRKIPGVFVGNRFFTKLRHIAEDKGQARGGGGYTSAGEPAKGGESGSKRLSLMDSNALLSHGAVNVIRDASTVRGQRNDDYWLQFMQGHNPKPPSVPLIYRKFVNELKAAGINPVRQGRQIQVMALTDRDIQELAGDRELKNAETVRWGEKLEPIKGGLFDPALTGGHDGGRWAKITLAEPMPSPVMEEPIRRVLGLTVDKLEQVIAGNHELEGYGTGPQAIRRALDSIDLDKAVARAKVQVKTASKSKRDQAVRRLKYLESARQLGMHPRDWMLSAVPVLPPQFRPVNVIGDSKVPLIADANQLYQELFEANQNLRQATEQLGSSETGDERLAVYRAFKAVTGLGDPITEQSQQRQVKGLLRSVFGDSPKRSTMQRRLLSSTVDNVGRAVISPDPNLDMDTIGLPEDQAFDAYARFIVRRLRRRGVPLTRGLMEVKQRTDLARQALLQEMEQRPVVVNRAPVLHRFGIMAFRPTLVKGSTMRVSPLVYKGFGADNDGNCVVFSTKISLTVDPLRVRLSENGRLWWSALEDSLMRVTETQRVTLRRDRACTVTLPIGEVPRLGTPARNSAGQQVYDLPPGVEIVTYDHMNGAVFYTPVTSVVYDPDQPCSRIKTDWGRELELSNNESVAVFDPESGDVIRVRPADSVGKLVPMVRKEPVVGDEFDFDTGWLYGALIADGWISDRYVGYSKNDPDRIDRVVEIARRIEPNFIARNYSGKKAAGKFSDSLKVHLFGTPLTEALMSFYADGGKGYEDVRGAILKKVPDELFDRGGRECLLGLLCGLIDGDCSLIRGTKTNSGQRRLSLRFNTSSPWLVESILRLLRMFGVRATVGYAKARGQSRESWHITPSLADVRNMASELRLYRPDGADWIAELLARDESTDPLDFVPVKSSVLKQAATEVYRAGETTLYGSLRNGLRAGYILRQTLNRALPFLSPTTAEALQQYATTDMCWARVKSCEAIETQDVFDLTVPTTKLYMGANGLIIYDTMQYHVPTDDEARKEALSRMLPSRQLISVADFKSPVHMASQEYIGGLYTASTERSKRPVQTFATTQDVIDAYRRGEIGITDPVKVLRS